jgi:hypothetical protein
MEQKKKEKRKEGRKQYASLSFTLTASLVQVAHHFRDFTYNTDRKINLKRHCLPFEA